MTRLQQVLAGQEDNYILPFFWQHGEEEALLRHYMHVIHDAHIGAVCVEARPHPDFAGEKWWKDLDAIIDEAKKLDMKVWILDDAHFPSGQAAGKMEEEPDELCKQYLNYRLVEVTGPVPQMQLEAGRMARHYDSPFNPPDIFGGGGKKRQFDDDALMAVIASRMDGKEGDISHLDDTLLDLTAQVKDGRLLWDVPEGSWRVFVIYATRKGGGRDNYINFLSKRSCRVQIDAVYEPHYARYKEEFGRTIAGFFSDEPEIGNMPGYDRDASIGNPKMPLPWSEEMPALMAARFGDDYIRKVVALWFSVGEPEFTADIRTGYMDIVTRQCQKNFGEQMGDWCREHGVEYIGHIIEDCGMSTRLGASQGHFFRALRGQDWGGIDDIGAQITLGGENNSHSAFFGEGDGEFYHHVLGKLGASIAHIEERKAGRAMCEEFGAYGWSEGTRLMKYITDHLLVRGINRFVPHAFSPKEFPDPDCPPHFYAQGKNPLYKPFGTLMQYTNRISHLIDGGVHVASVALLYHAEAEWASMGCMDMVRPARVLDEHQIDYDFVPADIFTEHEVYKTRLDAEGLHLGRETYRALIVPGSGYVPAEVLEFAAKAKQAGFPVYFVTDDTQAPGKLLTGGSKGAGELAKDMTEVPLHQLAAELSAKGICDAVSDTEYAWLQIYHYEQEGEGYYLISNEHAARTYSGTVQLPVSGVPYRYDAFENRLYRLEYEKRGAGAAVPLVLGPYEMAVIVFDRQGSCEGQAAEVKRCGAKAEEIAGGWSVSFVENEKYPAFEQTISIDKLENVLLTKPDFSGVIRYENTVVLDGADAVLEFEDAYESVEVWCNDRYAGERICPPYRFDLSTGAEQGSNRLRVEVRTTLERRVNALTGGMGPFGPQFEAIMPSGLLGRAVIYQP